MLGFSRVADLQYRLLDLEFRVLGSMALDFRIRV